MTEEIITALSRVSSFLVVARNSTFAYKGTSPNVRQVGRDLGVRYVLEGSVRKAGERVRITGQLIDATTGMHIWADRFDGVFTGIFELQDQIAGAVVGAIEPEVQEAEIEVSAQAGPKFASIRSRPAQPLRLRGVHSRWLGEAIQLLRKAVEIAPNYALALALLARANGMAASMHWITPTESELEGHVKMARDAVRYSPDDAEVLVPAASIIAVAGGDFTDGFALVDRACVLNRNSTDAWALSGGLRAYAGKSKSPSIISNGQGGSILAYGVSNTSGSLWRISWLAITMKRSDGPPKDSAVTPPECPSYDTEPLRSASSAGPRRHDRLSRDCWRRSPT